MMVADGMQANRDEGETGAGWRRFGVFILAFAAVGLPVNDISVYALLVILVVIVFTGEIRSQARAWLAAIAIVLIAAAGQIWLAPPRIDEGHNLFLPGGPTQALKHGLPTEVYSQLAAAFDKQYPPEQYCKVEEAGCWLSMGFPDRTFAFSADGIFHKSDLSRTVTGISFSDPVWLGLGFFNEIRYNWYPASDVQRASRNQRFWMGLQRWRVTMPWFEMIRLPAAYAGGELCWRGDLMWEGPGEHFELLRGDHCRTIGPADAGRRIFGLAIKPDSLAMWLTPPWSVRLLQVAQGALALGALVGLVLALVTVKARRLIVPFVLIGLSVAVIAIQDSTFLGGVWPFLGGDDGLFYEGVGRMILQSLLDGDYVSFLIGSEKVFYYGGPALRYFRAFEHILFGESFLGYLSLILLMPFLVYALFRRFLPEAWALALSLIFIAIPIGHLFGTTFIDYVAWAERGYADPAAYILFIAGLLPLLGAKPSGTTALDANTLGLNEQFAPALFGALLVALGIAMKPLIAPAAAVFLGGAGFAAICCRQWRRLAGMCIGFAPVFLITLHNWVFGHVFVLFSANATHPLVLNMPPAAYADAFRELVTLDFAHGQFLRALMKIREWLLSGPYQFSRAMIPINAAGVVILIYVVVWGRRFDQWLRLVGGAAIAQHTVAFFYVSTARYHFLTWFLTMLVVVAFVNEVGIDWLRRRFPNISTRLDRLPSVRWLASGLAWLEQQTERAVKAGRKGSRPVACHHFDIAR
jgi:hypothetical protein